MSARCTRRFRREIARFTMKRFSYRFLLCAIVLVAAPIAEAMAQQTPTPVPLAAPPGPVSRFPSHFMVLDAPEQFDQVLLIVDFPSETWTLPYAPSGYVYSTLIEGELTL